MRKFIGGTQRKQFDKSSCPLCYAKLSPDGDDMSTSFPGGLPNPMPHGLRYRCNNPSCPDFKHNLYGVFDDGRMFHWTWRQYEPGVWVEIK